MPLFEYRCRDCNQVSEVLVRGAEQPVCAHCGSRRLDKQLSAFAAPRGGAGPEPACASCCSASPACPYQGGACTD